MIHFRVSKERGSEIRIVLAVGIIRLIKWERLSGRSVLGWPDVKTPKSFEVTTISQYIFGQSGHTGARPILDTCNGLRDGSECAKCLLENTNTARVRAGGSTTAGCKRGEKADS